MENIHPAAKIKAEQEMNSTQGTYDGTAVYADGDRAGFTVFANDAKEAQQLIAQKAVQHKPSVSMLYVESVYRRQE